jgi:hypothetical protein
MLTLSHGSRGEAERGGLNHTDHINKALRQYIIELVGDKPVSLPRRERQSHKVQKSIDETLPPKGFAQAATF